MDLVSSTFRMLTTVKVCISKSAEDMGIGSRSLFREYTVA